MWRKRAWSILLSWILAVSLMPLSSTAVLAQDGGEPAEEIAMEAVQTDRLEGTEAGAAGEEILSAGGEDDEDPRGDDPVSVTGLEAGNEDPAPVDNAEILPADPASAEDADNVAAGPAAAEVETETAEPAAAEEETEAADPAAAEDAETEAADPASGTDAQAVDPEETFGADHEAAEAGDSAEAPDADDTESADAAGAGRPGSGDMSSAAPEVPEVTDGSQDLISTEAGLAPDGEGDNRGAIWFDIPFNRLYSDGIYTFDLHTEGIEGDYIVDLELGHYGDEGLVEAYTQGAEYDFNPLTGTLTLYGDRLFARGYRFFGLMVEALDAQTQETLCGNWCMFDILEAREEYWQQEDDRMLPGWDWCIDRWNDVRAEGVDHPDGWNGRYETTGIEVVDQNPAEAGKQVISLYTENGGSDDARYHFRAENHGSAVIRVSYKDLSGAAQSYDFRIEVLQDVYGVQVFSEDGSTRALPGGTIHLQTRVWHHAENGEEEGQTDGLTYVWKMNRVEDHLEPSDFASLTVGSDGKTASVKCKDLQGGEEGVWDALQVEVAIYRGAVSEANRLDTASIRLERADQYLELWPAAINSGMDVGRSQKVTAEFRMYPGSDGNEYDLPGAGSGTVKYYWFYDENAVQIFDADGLQVGNEDENGDYKDSEKSSGAACDFTIYRRRPWGTDIWFSACWTDQNGEDHWEDRNFRLDEMDYRAWLDLRDNRVFSDGTGEWPLMLEGISEEAVYGTDYEIEWTIGKWEDNGIEDPFTEGVEYSFDGKKLTIHGDKLAAAGMQDEQEFGAELLLIVGGESVWADEWNIRYCEAREEYDREDDRDMLPGWDGSVDGRRNCRIRSAEYPDGLDREYRVLNVELVRDQPWEGQEGDVITDFHRDQDDNDPDNYWWYYRTEHCGEAEFKVTYEDLDGREQTYTFTIHVGTDVYDVFMDSENGERNAFPGGEIPLYADALHQYLDENGDYQRGREGIGYAWSLVFGEEYAEIEADPADPSRAVLKFKDLPADRDWIDEDVMAAVRILDAPQGEETGGYFETVFWVRSQYTEIHPLRLDPGLDPGDSIADQKFETRRYVAGQEGYEVIDDLTPVRYEWHYDENALTVSETKEGQTVRVPDGGTGSGNTFTITRNREWYTDYSVCARWTEPDGRDEDEWADYRFWQKDVGDEEDQIISAQDVTMTMFDTAAASVTDARGALTYMSSNTGIVRISPDGTLTPAGTGTATVTVNAAAVPGYRPGTTSFTVTVTPLDLADERVAVTNDAPAAGYTYHGKAQKPQKVTVTYTNTSEEAVTLQEGTDYTITWPAGADLINAGTKTVTLRGQGDCTGTVTTSYQIKRADQKLTLKAAAATVKTGFTTRVTAGGAKETTAYSYKSSNTAIAAVASNGTVTGKKAGTVTITVTTPQTANYKSGKATATIRVETLTVAKPSRCGFLKWSNASYNKCVISWSKVADADGYETLLSWTDGSHATRKEVKANVLQQTCSVADNHVSQFKARAFVRLPDGTKKYSLWSNVTYITPSPKTWTCKKVNDAAGMRANISWNIIYGCNGYNVFVTTNPNGTWYWNQSTTEKAGATSAVISKYRGAKLKKGQRYYVRIITRRKRNGVFCTVPMPSASTSIGSFIF